MSLGVATSGSPAGAAPTPESEQHCSYDLETQTVRCYPVFADVTRALSAGSVALNSPRELTESVVQQMAAASKASKGGPGDALADVVLGVVYSDAGWLGASYTFYAGHTCATGSFQVTPMPAGWDNRVSAFSSYSSCRTTLYENPNFNRNAAGAVFGPAVEASIGAVYMNDKTSSVVYQK